MSKKEIDASNHDQWLRDEPSALAKLLSPLAGYGVTISSMFRPVETERYPFEKPRVMPRFHGRHQLNRYDDGLEKCIGCELCAWACPADAIYVEAAPTPPKPSTLPVSVTGASTRSTTCAAFCAVTALRLVLPAR